VASQIVAAPGGAYVVRTGKTEQSWVDPQRPLLLEFDYVQRIAEVLEETVLAWGGDAERLRVVHVGGGGLTLPRYVAERRPHTAQVVLEPDADLVEEVRRVIPLPPRSGIKIRPVDGRTGLAAMPDDYADALVLDAFANAQVPAGLATVEWFAEVGRVLRPGGVAVMNVTDKGPFNWARRCLAGVASVWPHAALVAEVPVFKGRRFGNLVAAASSDPLPIRALERDAARAPFPNRLLHGPELASWIGNAVPFTDADAQPSEDPFSRGWFS
jgi:spermidine synthase